MNAHWREDEDFRELLQEVATDQASTLLRVTPREQRLALYNDDSYVSERAAGWSSAERKLLEVHRSRLADFFEDCFLNAFFEVERAQTLFGPHVSATRRYRSASRREMRQRSEQLLRRGSVDVDELRLVVEGRSHEIPLAGFALLSLQLRPSNKARMYLALESVIGYRYTTALRLLHQCLDSSRARRASVLSNIGLVQSCMDDERAALVSYKASAELDPGLLSPPISALSLAVNQSDLKSVVWAAERVDSLLGPDHPATLDRTQSYQRRQEQGVSFSVEPVQVLEPVWSQIGPTSRRILGV